MSLLIVNFSKATRGIALAMPSFCISYLDMSLTFLSYYGAVEKNKNTEALAFGSAV